MSEREKLAKQRLERILELQKLKEAALPLIKYLNENHHPEVKAIVTNTSVELLEGKMIVPKIYDFLDPNE